MPAPMATLLMVGFDIRSRRRQRDCFGGVSLDCAAVDGGGAAAGALFWPLCGSTCGNSLAIFADGLGSGSGIWWPRATGSRLFGTSMTKCILCRSRPETRAASAPAPKYRSARAGPVIADPVSCAIISRRNGVFDCSDSIGNSPSMKNGVP